MKTAHGIFCVFPIWHSTTQSSLSLGSRIVMVAVNNQIRDLDLLHLTYAQKAVIGSGGYMPEDVCDVMEIMKSGRWDTEKIITHEFPLFSLPEAIKKASDTENAFNVVINFDM